jgi:beta-galactosidase
MTRWKDDPMTLSRREWLTAAAALSGAALLPEIAWADSAQQAGPAATVPPLAAPLRERLLADFGWKFHFGHANDPAQDFGFGAGRVFDKVGRLFAPSTARFDDSAWHAVDLPHDWAVDLPFENAAELNDFGYKPLGRNFPATSIGWYRRVFDIPATDSGRRLAIEFDGVFRNATFALNGHLLGTNFSGYAPVRYDITDLVTYGGRNVLVVRVDATEREGWFYEGAGIYRHVWLEKTPPLHLAHWGTRVTSELSASGAATVHVSAEVANDDATAASCHVVCTVLDGSGRAVVTATSSPYASIPAWDQHTFSVQVPMAKPALWSPDDPHLYRLVVTVEKTTGPVDKEETPFGIRTIRFDPNDGFFLNGKRLELKGTCNHQDHAGVGSALPDRLHEFRVQKLKEMGCNAWRTAHNPPAPEVLDACDRLGMLVLDETRLFSSNDEGLSQLERMVRRDRNHPCVFAWSIANEEWSDQAVDRGRRIAETLRRFVHQLDPSRLVTGAMDSGYENGKGISLAIDVQGFNYQRENIDAFHAKNPALPLMGTETASAYSTRGVYVTDKDKGYVSAYDVNKPDYAATAEQWWSFYAARPFLAGGFAWTGFDYRGEPSPYEWPCISSHFGILDTCGFPKDSFFYYQAWWSGKPVLHLFPHWNWEGKEGQPIDVWCFTNLEAVELFLNGRSLGRQAVAKNGHAMWKVPYEPGVIEVRATTGLPSTAPMATRETTGAPAKIVLRPDRATIAADGEDVSIVEVQVVDEKDRLVPTAGGLITFSATGGGKIIGVGNGDPSCHEPDHASARSAFNGLCLAIVQSTKQAGQIRVEATSPGLTSATVTITAQTATPRPSLA